MSDNRNLLKETIDDLCANMKNARTDVRWVGSRDGKIAMSWDEFRDIAEREEYHAGFGGQEIAADLVVVGDDWWLERHEYDGSEWWEFKTTPVRAPDAKPFTFVNRQKAREALEDSQPHRYISGNSLAGMQPNYKTES